MLRLEPDLLANLVNTVHTVLAPAVQVDRVWRCLSEDLAAADLAEGFVVQEDLVGNVAAGSNS
jgi:hypothetical protein